MTDLSGAPDEGGRRWLPSRLPALMRLTDAWDESSTGDGMRLVVVRGSSGAGRTELLRRCYEHCAWSQRYWPNALPHSPADISQPLLPDHFRVSAGVAIPYLWLALTGRPGAFPVLDADEQLRAHLSALRTAVLAADTVTKRRLLSTLDAGLLVGSFLPFTRAIATAINTAGAGRSAPGLLQDIRLAYAPAEPAIADALAANAGRIVNPGQREAARELVTNEALSWARAGSIVPFVVAVDDAQELDPATITFLSTLLRHSGQGLMILAVNTDGEAVGGPAGGNPVLAAWLDEQARMTAITVIELDPVPDAELTELALDRLAVSGEAVSQTALAEVIRASDGAPRRLMTLLADPRVRRAVTHPEAVLPDLGRIDKKQVLERQWEALPTATREALAKLALCGPRVPEDFTPTTADPIEIERAATTGWLRTATSQFRSSSLWETAYAHAQDQLTDDQEEAVLDEFSRRVAAARREGSWASLEPGVAESLLEALIRGNGIDGEPDAMADLMRLRRVTGREAARESLLDAIHRRLSDGQAGTPLIVATAEALHDAGRDRQALDLLEDRLEEAIREHGEESAATIAPLSNLAAYWTALAHRRAGYPDGIEWYDHAISLCTQVLDLRIKHLPSDDKRIPDTRIRLADLYSNRNHPRDAVSQLAVAVEEYRKLLSYDHPRTLTLRNNLAHAYWSAGNLTRAIRLFEQTLTDRERVLGPDHPNTLTSRNNLAAAYELAGDPTRAIPLHVQTLADRERVLGPDHPDTLTSRNNLAGAYQSDGNPTRAIPLHVQTLADRERVLGPDHPDTLTSRNNLAGAYQSVGDRSRAIPIYEQTLTDCVRVLGPDHPQTRTIRTNLATAQREASHAEGHQADDGAEPGSSD